MHIFTISEAQKKLEELLELASSGELVLLDDGTDVLVKIEPIVNDECP